jgi:hypothetical protein
MHACTFIPPFKSAGHPLSCYLETAYGVVIMNEMRMGVNFMEKDFQILYLQARPIAFTIKAIQNGFRATGLVPLNPTKVLERLLLTIVDVDLVIPPPLSVSIWTLEILHNTAGLIS